jgi:uncharacterized membrane protein YhaH (DUF805 family)
MNHNTKKDKFMLKTYFGEWGTGKLHRLPYLGYYVLLMVLVMAIIFGSIMLVGKLESIMDASIVETQAMLMDKFGILGIIGILVLVFGTIAAQINILGKRIRDMGLPVLWTILGIIVLSMVLNIIFPPHEVTVAAASVEAASGTATAVATTTTTSSLVVQIFDAILFLCLVLIPGNTFKNKSSY